MQPPRCHGPQMRATQVTQAAFSAMGSLSHSAVAGVLPTGWPALRRAMTNLDIVAVSHGPEAM